MEMFRRQVRYAECGIRLSNGLSLIQGNRTLNKESVCSLWTSWGGMG